MTGTRCWAKKRCARLCIQVGNVEALRRMGMRDPSAGRTRACLRASTRWRSRCPPTRRPPGCAPSASSRSPGEVFQKLVTKMHRRHLRERAARWQGRRDPPAPPALVLARARAAAPSGRALPHAPWRWLRSLSSARASRRPAPVAPKTDDGLGHAALSGRVAQEGRGGARYGPDDSPVTNSTSES